MQSLLNLYTWIKKYCWNIIETKSKYIIRIKNDIVRIVETIKQYTDLEICNKIVGSFDVA